MDKKYKVSSDSEALDGLFWWASEVFGPEACEIPEFTPTKHELIQIAKSWYNRVLDYGFFYFALGQYSSTHWLVKTYANRRIGRVAKILSEKEFNELLADVERGFKEKHISDEEWNTFTKGSQEEWAAHQDKVWKEIERMDGQPKSDP